MTITWFPADASKPFVVPTYATVEAAGMDVRSAEALTIEPGEFKMVDTNLKVDLPELTELQVRPRSGLAAKYGVTVLNTPGTIDSDYMGVIKVILINHGKSPFKVEVGDRIAQFVFANVLRPSGVITLSRPPEEAPVSGRGEGGFGSTGVK